MIPKPKHKSDRQKAIKRLDNLFSEYIRKRAMKLVGGCQRCRAPKRDYKELQTAHFHSRRKYSVRWDERNAVGLCGGCHMYLDSHIDEKQRFARTILGEEYMRLYMLAEMTVGNSPTDYQLLEIYYRQAIKELEGG